jgi:hypothetical protein
MDKIYPGTDKDLEDGISQTGNIVRDAWVFGILPESETCTGWSIQRILEIYDKVTEAWQPYGHLASQLPDELRERHKRIYDDAIAKARSHGWNPELDDND